MARRSGATRGTYACTLDAFARCFDVQSVGLLVAKIKSGELDAYNTLDKFVGRLPEEDVAPRGISASSSITSVCLLSDSVSSSSPPSHFHQPLTLNLTVTRPVN